MNGIVQRVIPDRKFGFIMGEDGKSYFFHLEDLHGFFDDLVADLEKGIKIAVKFESKESFKGPRAGEVYRLDNGVVTEINH